MKRNGNRRKGHWAALTPLFWALCGCVAVDVGQPETFLFDVPSGQEKRTVSQEVLFSQVVAETDDGEANGEGTVALKLSLHGLLDQTEQIGRLVNKVEATRQKRLSFGLFPGTAEWIFRPNGWALAYEDMTPAGMTPELVAFRDEIHWGGTVHSQPMPDGCLPFVWILVGGTGALYSAALTPYFLFVEPFAGHWTCQTHACWMDRVPDAGRGADGRGELRLWQTKGGEDFRKVEPSMIRENMTGFIHWVPLGFFRHSFWKFSEERPGEWVPQSGAKHVRERVTAAGPYRVELSIPSLGYREERAAWRGTDKVAFEVPRGEVPGEVAALVRYRTEGAAADERQRALLDDAARWTQVLSLYLPGAAGAETRVVVVDAQIRGAALRYAKVREGENGSSAWVVEILDAEKEALDVAAFARPLILEELRAGWLERHPGEDGRSVRAWADWETGDNENTLVFRGAAFSVRPAADGWRYDAATRRGEIRLRLPEDADAESARAWARENVESIARDHAAALESGGVPPEGALYRSLSERLEDGVLTLRFEVAE